MKGENLLSRFAICLLIVHLIGVGDSYADTENDRNPDASSWKEPSLITLPGRSSDQVSDGHVFTGFPGANSINFIIKNNCPYTIWPGTLTSSGPAFPSTGFELAQGASRTLTAQPSWSGRIWARSQCFMDGGRFVCRSADCGSGQVACNGGGAIPPASLAEFTLNGHGNLDYYDVSLVDGFNLPVRISPRAGCPSTACPVDVNRICPQELSIRDPRGGIIGCKSACLAFHQDQYCCTGSHNTPKTCPPTNYSQFFKNQCPQAYSYAYDDTSSTFTCGSGSTNYVVTFCP
ncbi:thaumatin-like protein 1b [Silene latifolia]|uniref:thaumatin-like protein 1b n=1 Tax=Silene latifolia TaxID=37657 RepID=UPI003D773D5D